MKPDPGVESYGTIPKGTEPVIPEEEERGCCARYCTDICGCGPHACDSPEKTCAFTILFITRFLRLFSYGALGVVLFLFLMSTGLSHLQVGIVLTSTLIGDILITFILTTRADGFGRRWTLLIGAALKFGAGICFATSTRLDVLILAGTIGVITPTGKEIGPFMAVEQAALTELFGKDHIASLFAWYNLVGYGGSAAGAVTCGWILQTLQTTHQWTELESYRAIIVGYAFIGVIMAVLYFFLPAVVEPRNHPSVSWFGKFGLHRPESRAIVARLSALFVIDAFAGGFVMNTLTVYWFHTKFGLAPNVLGTLLMVTDLVAALSGLLTSPLVSWFCAIHTMVFTHFPSNILLLLIPFMPTPFAAMIMLILRCSISQMDVPARQAYVAMVVAVNERSAAGGITNLVRSVGLSLSPMLAAKMVENPQSFWFAMPFILSGALKCVYDVIVYLLFRFSDAGQKDVDLPTQDKEARARRNGGKKKTSIDEGRPLIMEINPSQIQSDKSSKD